MLPRNRFFYTIIFIEGYVVLAAELLAMRLLQPFVGSGVEVISVVISAVLLPLAFGYHVGGRRYQEQAKLPIHNRQSVRRILIRNILSSIVILSFSLSYLFLELFFGLLSLVGVQHYLLQTTFYALLFIVKPVFLLGQTVPLVSHYFSQVTLSKITGRMLCFSTVGSFMGSVISTVILMNVIGVHLTAVFTVGLLLLLLLILCKKRQWFDLIIAAFIYLVMVLLNHPASLKEFGIVASNAYNTVSIIASEHKTDMILNKSNASRYAKDPKHRFDYIRYLENTIIHHIADDQKLLVLGAGAFTLGIDRPQMDTVFVDIDEQLKDVAEAFVLPEKLPDTKKFVSESARVFLNHTDQQFDVIVVDVFSNRYSIPSEAVTQEFWKKIDAVLAPNGVLAVNTIISPTLDDRFSARFIQTFSSVFPNHVRQVIQPYNALAETPDLVNMELIYRKHAMGQELGVYMDELNPHSLDKYVH